MLDLQSFWIQRLEYEEEDEVPDDPPATTVRVSRPEILDAGDGKYLVTLRLKVAQGEARSLDLTVAGAFLLPPDAEGQPSHLGMLLYNGSAILFSAARGIVESVTGVSGPMLPSTVVRPVARAGSAGGSPAGSVASAAG